MHQKSLRRDDWKYSRIYNSQRRLRVSDEICRTDSSQTRQLPLPLSEDVIDKLHSAKFVTTLDLKNGFSHVPINESSKKTFRTFFRSAVSSLSGKPIVKWTAVGATASPLPGGFERNQGGNDYGGRGGEKIDNAREAAAQRQSNKNS
ncbi:hypothetical protein TNCV_4024781 [Trichonephila clavipes]|uniref:Reverse transcriptase domain-containing protein n=1 Tax=Trichonephila clavipes TaxID=2585209 RepID=A0A8X7BJP0_TRICX|nr:hypothetical protein TNCV_4024781 [Trichonephila clavipes]